MDRGGGVVVVEHQGTFMPNLVTLVFTGPLLSLCLQTSHEILGFFAPVTPEGYELC